MPQITQWPTPRAWLAPAALLATFCGLLWLERRQPLRRRTQPPGHRLVRDIAIGAAGAAAVACFEMPLASRAARLAEERLSGGERQKVAIARLLMQRPRLILADEPTASLDPTATSDVCELLVQAAQGATLVTVVHDTRLLPLLADRVVALRQGRCVFDLPVTSVGGEQLASLYRVDVSPPVSQQAARSSDLNVVCPT